ncbi:28689_t:CDS:2 [Gigaspora margarita]|uniref:28689_t:CDS:1 n=1 Tax=Gigaspora margarita TaxID=4874 RepID=A0ABM8W173_GIGMA|nr:28689_t:CDS:2 [Gigaspora margarita]
MVEEKILIEEKLEDEKISSVEDGIKGDHFLLNKKRIIDNINDSIAEMTLNKSELEVLSEENLEEAENKAALLYAEYKTDKSKKPVLEETLVSKANLNVEDKDKMVVDKKKYLTENTISKNKKIQEKVKKCCKMIVNNQGQMLVNLLNKPYNKIIINKLVLEKHDHSRELITKPEEVMSITEKHFQNQYQKRNARPNLLTQKWAEIYKPASYVQESLYENLLEEISEEE